jgi:hypothetical protein
MTIDQKLDRLLLLLGGLDARISLLEAYQMERGDPDEQDEQRRLDDLRTHTPACRYLH